MQVGLRIAAAVALALILGAAPFTSARAADPIEVNALLPMTGPLAFYGAGIANGLNAEESVLNAGGGINGRTLHFVISDDQANPQVAVQLTSALVSKGAPIIFDGGPAATCKATANTAKNSAVVLCLSAAYDPADDPYSFTTPMSFESALAAQVRYFRVRGFKRIGFIIGTDATGQIADSSLTHIMTYPENKDMVLVARERFGTTDLSVTAQVAKLKAGNPQAVFLAASGAPLGLILREMRDAGMELPTGTIASNQSVQQLVSYGNIVPPDLELVAALWAGYDVMGKGPIKDKVTQFRDAMARAGHDADGPASIGWDFGLFVAAAYHKYGASMTPTNLKDYIASARNLPGICGTYDFVATPGRGLTDKDTVVLHWNGTRKTFDPISTPGGAAVLKT